MSVRSCACAVLGAALLLVFEILLASQSALADWGLSLIRIECDASSGKVEIEPFILWSGELQHHGVVLKDPELNQVQTYGNDKYYYIENRFKTEIHATCQLDDRSVDVSFKFNRIDVQENVGGAKLGFEIDFNDPSLGGAWWGWGPTYWLRSQSVRKWVACAGHEKRAEMVCNPIVLNERP
jgi:hypothetical protein